MAEATRRQLIRSVDRAAARVCRELQEAGFEAVIAGGAVRDLVRRVTPEDFDIATSATPEEVSRVFRRVIPTGIRHGTVTVLLSGQQLEVTTFRSEGAYSDRRHPDSVQFVRSLNEDLKRRDFTMNGMALDPVSGRFHDPFSGEQDIQAKTIRAIGAPQERFSEDALRVLRAIRFATQLGFHIEQETLAAVGALAGTLNAVSHERVRDELNKILLSPAPSIGFRIMRDTGILDAILPELAAGVDVEQRGEHLFDVFEHSLVACDRAPADKLEVRLAALLHDIGKPAALAHDTDGTRTFHGHEKISRDQAESLMRRLKYPNKVIQNVVHLIAHHMFNYTEQWSDAAVRRFLTRVGTDSIEDLFALRKADSEAQKATVSDERALNAFRLRIADVLSRDHALTRKDLAVSGNDLVEVGIPKGPAMGTVLDHLFETVLDDPAQNTREQLLSVARAFYQTRIDQPGDSSQGV